MQRYSTEIHVPNDRHITVQLPDGMPEGRAVVIVYTLDAGDPRHEARDHDDREDIEWWDEFEDFVENRTNSSR